MELIEQRLREAEEIAKGKGACSVSPSLTYLIKMLRGEFRQFSVERLLRFLVALNHDVEIVVRPHRGERDTAELHVP